MKKNKILTATLLPLFTFLMLTCAVAQKIPSVVVAGVEARNTEMKNTSLADILNLQLRKINTFDVTDYHDALQISGQKQIQLSECLSRQCMTDLGAALGVDKVLTGQLEKYNENIYFSIRVLDVASKAIEKNFSMEFLSLESEIPFMIEVTLRKMYDLPVDELKLKQITTLQALENKAANPAISRLDLSGPRFGFTLITGTDGKSFKRKESEGGFDAFPLISNFGYQFEIAYLNQGIIQGLVEIVPSISGLELGTVIPSLAILHGVRSNKSGLEFEVGPIFVLSKRSEGYYDDTGAWIRRSTLGHDLPKALESRITNELDRDGSFSIDGGLLMAVGKSFRSGNINFPFNFFTYVRKNSVRLGFSMGFNTKKKSS